VAAAADDGAIMLAEEGVPLAAFTVEDSPRPESPRAVSELRRLGLPAEILSGDAPAAVARLARRCGIETYYARQSPTDKLERVKTLTRAGEFIAMVGDGINDAPVLGGAGVSVAMSRASALALASADLILVGDSLQALPAAFRLARRASRVIRQNLLWAGAYNLVSMPLAALGWVPPSACRRARFWWSSTRCASCAAAGPTRVGARAPRRARSKLFPCPHPFRCVRLPHDHRLHPDSGELGARGLGCLCVFLGGANRTVR
jgi:cation transport ATPase